MDEIRQKRRKKKKITKRKIIVVIIIILILVGIFFLINRLIPVKNINDNNISVKLSTTKPTGKDISASVSTKTKYNIYYYIDYSAGEEQYYNEDESTEEPKENKLDIKEIKNKQYKKVKDSKFEIKNNGIVY